MELEQFAADKAVVDADFWKYSADVDTKLGGLQASFAY